MKQPEHNKGFTLIELLMVIAIIAIIGTSSAVFFSRLLLQTSVANVQDEMVSQLRKAQIYAMAGKRGGEWGVRYGSNLITLFQGTSYATRNIAFDENFSVNPNISISGFTEIEFSRITGLPNITPTITISGNSGNKTITVNSQGIISR